MPSQDYRSVIVTGVAEDRELVEAHAAARALFDPELVSAITPAGHNFIASFAVFPSGSGKGREASKRHDAAIKVFVKKLREFALDFVVVHWSDDEGPEIVAHHAEDAAG